MTPEQWAADYLRGFWLAWFGHPVWFANNATMCGYHAGSRCTRKVRP